MQELLPNLLLQIVLKVLERVIHKETVEFFDKYKTLYKFQSSFWKTHSTDFCLPYLTDKIANGFDSGIVPGMILINLQKVYDTIDHNILIQNIPSLGFSSKVIYWFSSYLSCRKFYVNVYDLWLLIYDEFHKDPLLDLFYYCYLSMICHRL